MAQRSVRKIFSLDRGTAVVLTPWVSRVIAGR
jgi:hypothetical protein